MFLLNMDIIAFFSVLICVKYQKEKYRVSKNKEEKTEENEDILLVEGKNDDNIPIN